MASKLYERLGVVGRVPPTQFTTAATAASSNPIDMVGVDRLLAILSVGALTGTVGIALQAATSTVASDFAAFASALEVTGLTGGSVERLIELNSINMPAGKRYLRALITGSFSSTNTGQVQATLIAEPDIQPATHASTVGTVVSR